MQTLLIWELIPEDTFFYDIPDAPEWLSKVHGHFVNLEGTPDDVTDLLLRVSDALCEDLRNCDSESDPLATQWAKYKVNVKMGSPMKLEGDYTVVHCGFML